MSDDKLANPQLPLAYLEEAVLKENSLEEYDLLPGHDTEVVLEAFNSEAEKENPLNIRRAVAFYDSAKDEIFVAEFRPQNPDDSAVDDSLPGSGVIVYRIKPSGSAESYSNYSGNENVKILTTTPLNEVGASFSSLSYSDGTAAPFRVTLEEFLTDKAVKLKIENLGHHIELSLENLSEKDSYSLDDTLQLRAKLCLDTFDESHVDEFYLATVNVFLDDYGLEIPLSFSGDTNVLTQDFSLKLSDYKDLLLDENGNLKAHVSLYIEGDENELTNVDSSYTIDSGQSAALTLALKKIELAPVYVGEIQKPYDGTKGVTLDPAKLSLSPDVSSDNLGLSFDAASFDTEKPGRHNIVFSGLKLTGADAAFYSLMAAEITGEILAPETDASSEEKLSAEPTSPNKSEAKTSKAAPVSKKAVFSLPKTEDIILPFAAIAVVGIVIVVAAVVLRKRNKKN